MSLRANVFLLVFVCIAAIMFVGMLAFIEGHNSAVDVTISNTTTAYYSLQSDANQSINKTMQYGEVFANANSPFPLLIGLFALITGLFAFALVVKKR